MFYRSSSDCGHENEKKNALLQQQSSAESLFSVLMDGYRESGSLHTRRSIGHRQGEIVSFPVAGERTLHPFDGLDDMTWIKLMQLSDEDDGEYATIAQKEDQDHFIIEPTPINIPDFQTVAQATGRFYTIDALRSGSGSPAMVHSARGNKPDGSMGAVESYVASLNEGPRKDVCGSFSDDEMENLHQKNGDSRFRLYQSASWNQRFQELIAYQKRTGNSQLPLTYIQDAALARWVKRQRYQYKLMMEGKSSTMTAESIQALEDIGFVWNSQRTAWWDRFEELVEFKRIHNHCNVPSTYSRNPSLAVWVKCQRRQYKLFEGGESSHLTPQRIRNLESIGFQWVLRSYLTKNLSSPDSQRCFFRN